MSAQKKHKALRIILISVGVLVLAVVGVAWYYAANYEQLIKKKLPIWVARATDSVYNVSVDDINISLFTRTVTLKNARLWPDTTKAGRERINQAGMGTTFLLDVKEINVTGINWEQIIADKEIQCGELVIKEPDLTIVTANVDSLADTTKKEKKQAIEKISIAHIALIDQNFTFIDKRDTAIARYMIKGGRTDVHNRVYDPQVPERKGNLLYSESVSVKVDTIWFKSKDGIYDMSTGPVSISSKNKSASIKNVRIRTALSKDEFHKRIGYQKDIYDVHFPSLDLNNIDIGALVDRQGIVVESGKLNNPSVEIYHSRMPPPDPNSKMGNYPNQLIQKLKLPLYIGTLHLSSGHLKYTEVSDVTRLPGSFHIEQMRGTVKNATNIGAFLQRYGNHCIVDLKGKFMNKSDMAAVFDFNLTDKGGAFEVTGTHRNLDAKQLDNIAKALANISIDSVEISKISFRIKGNENEGRAEITMLYKDLKVTLLDAKGGDTTKEKNVISLLSDALLIHDHNPMPGQGVRVGISYQKRNEYASFFNLIWKCLFEASIKTALKSNNIADAIAEKKATGPEKKKTLLQRIFGKKDRKEKQAREKEKQENKENEKELKGGKK